MGSAGKSSDVHWRDRCGLEQLVYKIPNDKLLKREIFALFITSLGAFIYFFVLIYIDYIKARESNLYTDYDA